MVDTDGLLATSCDCHRMSSSPCLHILLIERYHSRFNEAVIDGEEPAAFLVNFNYEGLRYLYSVATASGSERHHSHKRTIVTCDMSKNWHCQSCPRLSYALQCSCWLQGVLPYHSQPRKHTASSKFGRILTNICHSGQNFARNIYHGSDDFLSISFWTFQMTNLFAVLLVCLTEAKRNKVRYWWV